MIIQRILLGEIESKLFKDKAIILYGPRQAGKTTLVKKLTDDLSEKTLWFNGDEPDVQAILCDITSTRLKTLFGDSKIVIIDEAQCIDNIGMTIKLIVDRVKNVQVIATGSSAFDLANKTSEPLTGRKYEFHLYPLSFAEMVQHHGLLEEKRLLKQRLIFGYYPEIVTKIGEEIELLKLLSESYLYKDLLMLEQIKKPVLLGKILRALALQIGSEVSLSEVGQLVGADNKTVEKYIDLLTKTYIIYVLPAFSGNIRNEIKKGEKIYFLDNGIRNAIIGDFNVIERRADIGALWENFLIAERIKFLNNRGLDNDTYFWRTTQQQEIDYIECSSKNISAWEFKWNSKKKYHVPRTFKEAYSNAKLLFVNPENVDDFLIDRAKGD